MGQDLNNKTIFQDCRNLPDASDEKGDRVKSWVENCCRKHVRANNSVSDWYLHTNYVDYSVEMFSMSYESL